jgi:hypothetical protein
MKKQQVFTVYTVTDLDTRQVIYCGETGNYKARVRHHTREPHPGYTGGSIGRFRNMNVQFDIAGIFDTRPEAYTYQCKLQERYGLKTDDEIKQEQYAIGRQNIHKYNRSCRKFTMDQIEFIRNRYAQGGITQKTLAEQHGVTAGAITKIIRNKTYKS